MDFFEDGEVIELDLIDKAIESLVKEFAEDGEYDDDDLEIISTLIDGMIDEEIISDLPSEDASDEEMQVWIDISIPKIKEALEKYGDNN